MESVLTPDQFTLRGKKGTEARPFTAPTGTINEKGGLTAALCLRTGAVSVPDTQFIPARWPSLSSGAAVAGKRRQPKEEDNGLFFFPCAARKAVLQALRRRTSATWFRVRPPKTDGVCRS